MTTSLFTWQRAVIAAGLDPKVTITALRVALDSSQATGREVSIDDVQVAKDLQVSGRTIWRRVRTLVELGWLTQTAKPTYGGADQGGRRARYALAIPGLSSATTTPTTANDTPEVAGHPEPGACQTTPIPSDTSGTSMSDDTTSRLTKPAQSSDTTTPTRGELLASCGSSTTAAAAVDVSGAIEILASKIRQHTPLRGLRFDQLGLDRTQRVLKLIDQHGDQALVDHAITTCRVPAPTFAQAFLVGWEAMPAPGRRLALVKTGLCAAHGVQLSPSGMCTGCEIDARVGDA